MTWLGYMPVDHEATKKKDTKMKNLLQKSITQEIITYFRLVIFFKFYFKLN